MIGQGENDPIGINWEHQTFASSASSDTSLCLYNFRYKCVPFVYVNRGTSRMRILGSTLEKHQWIPSWIALGETNRRKPERLPCSAIFHNVRVPCFSELCPMSGH